MISSIPPETVRPEDLIRLADEALHLAKNGGRNRVVLTEDWASAVPPCDYAHV